MARPEAYELLDPASLKRWIISLKQPGVKGSYLIHADGEADLRAVYIAILAAKLMNFLDDDITEGVAEYIAKC
jgi:protein farnesyltransferase subunit beta